MRGVNYICGAQNNSAQVEIYIDRGKEDGKETNLKIFREFEKNKEQIEKNFGNKLDWEDLPESRACRIKLRSNLGGFRDEETWEDIHEFLVQNIIKLEHSTKKYIKNIDKLIG